MTLGKASALGVGFAAAIGLGVVIGLAVAERKITYPPGFEAYMSAPPSPVMVERTAEKAPARAAGTSATPSETRLTPTTPELQERLKPLLNKGTNMAWAADGFRDAKQFATVAHAARNTQVPFAVLKHHVLNEGKNLASVIRQFKPELDAMAEANRARAEATEDLAAIQQ
jgi:hypothetical protein